MSLQRRSGARRAPRWLSLFAFALIAPFLLATPEPGATSEPADLQPGLVGHYFNNQDFTDADQSIDVLKGVAQKWGKGRGNDWSARWSGFIEGPTTGDVEFVAEAIDGFRLVIGEEVVIDDLHGSGAPSGAAAFTTRRIPRSRTAS